MQIQTLYQETTKFAAQKHKVQKVPGTDLPFKAETIYKALRDGNEYLAGRLMLKIKEYNQY